MTKAFLVLGSALIGAAAAIPAGCQWNVGTPRSVLDVRPDTPAELPVDEAREEIQLAAHRIAQDIEIQTEAIKRKAKDYELAMTQWRERLEEVEGRRQAIADLGFGLFGSLTEGIEQSVGTLPIPSGIAQPILGSLLAAVPALATLFGASRYFKATMYNEAEVEKEKREAFNQGQIALLAGAASKPQETAAS